MSVSRPNIFISAAEHSADLHAASLIEAIRRLRPEARFVGLTGPRMRRLGCETVRDMTSDSAMLASAFLKVPQALMTFSRVDRLLSSRPLDLAIMVDAPTYHLPFSRRCKARGIPVLYYIAPQTWAWAEFRVNKIRSRVGRLAVIFPFEEAYFRGHGVDAVYVGHPLWDALARRRVDEAFVSERRAGNALTVSLLPGSRKHVIEEVLPGQLEVARTLRRRFEGLGLMISAADAEAEGVIAEILRRSGLDIPVFRSRHIDLINAADLVLVASGTAAVETAYHHKPMVVMYNASRVGYHLLGRWLIRTKYFCMVNILAGREVVPEFMPYYRSTEPIAARAVELLADPERRRRMSEALAEVIDPHVKTGASDNAAAQAVDLLDRNQRPRWTPAGSRHIIW
ncbi:MAG: lipid-A-disaccharide synthase [Phycisphaerae bacterium]|nr:lipid-A-disaccharide synthase [Phycisphaerae bacterium]